MTFNGIIDKLDAIRIRLEYIKKLTELRESVKRGIEIRTEYLPDINLTQRISGARLEEINMIIRQSIESEIFGNQRLTDELEKELGITK
jgi:hypothetical protein